MDESRCQPVLNTKPRALYAQTEFRVGRMFGNDAKKRADHKIQSPRAGRGAWAMLFVLEALIPLSWHEAKMRGLRLGSKERRDEKRGVITLFGTEIAT